MTNKYIDEIKKATTKHFLTVEELTGKFNLVENQRKNDTISETNFNNAKAEYETSIIAEQGKTTDSIKSVQERYNVAVDKWAMIDGEKLHPDADLLNKMRFTTEDLQELGAKHKDNQTMQRILKNYADDNDLSFISSPGGKAKKEAFEEIANVLTSAITGGESSYYGILASTPDAWEEFIQPHMQVMGSGAELSE